MFKVKYISLEVLAYAVREENDYVEFLIYEYGEWKWVSATLCEPIEEKQLEKGDKHD